MDNRTLTLVKVVVYGDKLKNHKCGKKWCPQNAIGCDEAQELSDRYENALADAVEMIQKLAWDECIH